MTLKLQDNETCQKYSTSLMDLIVITSFAETRWRTITSQQMMDMHDSLLLRLEIQDPSGANPPAPEEMENKVRRRFKKLFPK